MISPYKVTYAGFSSEDFDLICDLAFDSDSGATSSFLSREAVASETYRGAMKYVSTYKYTESLAPVITFIDKNFGDFTIERQRQVLKWITSKDTPSFINIYHDDSEVVSYAILGAFTSCDTYKLGNGRVVGFQCTFESCMPYALSDLYTITKTISSTTDNQITINIDTDDNNPVCPRIIIQEKGSVINIPAGTTLNPLSDMVENTVYFNGTTYYWKTAPSTDEAYFNSSTTDPNLSTTSIRFRNIHTDFVNRSKILDPVVVKNNTTTEQIIIDGANKIVSSDSVRRIFGDDFNWQWLELYDGKNEITIEGNCEVTIEYREVRKVGSY